MMGKGKNNQNTSFTTNSKRNQKKAAKNASEPEKLINLTSEDNSSALDTKKPATTICKPQVTQRGPLNKCTRTETAVAMNKDFTALSSSPLASSTTSDNSFNVTNYAAVQLQSEVVPLASADQ